MPIDTSKPILSGTAATIVGAIGTLLAVSVAFIPAPYNVPVGIVGFIAALLAGVAAKPPAVVEGKPVLQGTALTVAMGAAGMLEQFYTAIPPGWPQGLALGAMAALAWLTGKALPKLGSPSPETLAKADAAGDAAAAKVTDTASAADVMRKGPPFE